ncbi:MAG: glycosyltransferase [Chitinophagaceae bacterium]|nr:glycosyltransferase [Chitinophagaceae bacterium]
MVTILIVTYGNRWIFLENVLKEVLKSNDIIQIVVVDNGSTYDVKQSISIFNSNKIHVISITANQGSAFGFKTGLEYILKNSDTEFIWFLDDDNIPIDNCLIGLLSYWHSIQNPEKCRKQSLLALRIDREYLVNVSKGYPIEFNFPSKNAFLGFNLQHILGYLKYKVFSRNAIGENITMHNVEIPFAPYGGLFMHKDLVSVIGYPDIKFFLYADDFEYTNRIRIIGGSIMLLHNCKVADIESVWYDASNRTFLKSKYLEQNNFRSYYSIRNNVYLSLYFLCTSKLLFVINMIIYLFGMLLFSLVSFKLNRYSMFIKAVKDGLAGNFDNKI